ncbi:MAG: M20/M25/M40 family metallo-hydrolase [Planctomycetota bacterium]|nr:M20/M25/M40 family metallo-hydrolase [Planctomycetota bacterium]
MKHHSSQRRSTVGHWQIRCLIAAAAATSLLTPSMLLAGDDPITSAQPEGARRPANTHGWTAIVDGKDVAAPEIPMGDEVVVRSILDEGKNRNQVMQHLTYLTQEIGARLTGSTNVERANNWCKENYEKWGLSNAHIEEYGTIATRFDRGESTAKVMLRREKKKDDAKEGDAPEITYDVMRECEMTTMAWAAGTDGVVRGRIVREPKDAEQLEKMKDQLKGAWVLIEAPSPVGQRGIRSMMGARYDALKDARKKVADGAKVESLSVIERLAFAEVAGYISTSRDERVWTGAIPGWRELDADSIPKDAMIQVRLSDYDFINSRLTDEDPIEFEANLKHTFTKGPIPIYNTIAEIPGTEFPNEVVIVSAHLDSWNGPGSQGCTDNGTGSSVTLEAARILAAVGAKPRRTIRFINWTGEEQGLLGSKGYVDKHPEVLPTISAVFVDDGGTNYQGGVPCADVMADYLAAATAPTNYQFYSETDKKWMNVDIRKSGKRNPRGGGSDHATFNSASVPGFFWDEVGRADYGHGWHTQHDKLDLAIPEYLVQSSTNAAITAYRLACAPSMLPREEPRSENEPEDPAPRPRGRRGDRTRQ